MKDDVDDETSEKRKDTDGQAPPTPETCNASTKLQPHVSNAATLCIQYAALFTCACTQWYTKRQFLQYHMQNARGDTAKQTAKEAGLKHWKEAKPAPQHVESAVLVAPRLTSLSAGVAL